MSKKLKNTLDVLKLDFVSYESISTLQGPLVSAAFAVDYGVTVC